MEIWKDISGFPQYEVSNLGRIRSLKFGALRIMHPKTKLNGYLEITMSIGNKQTTKLVHRLVAVAFLVPDPSRSTVNHLDGNKTNNKDSNLCWSTLVENNAHSAHKRIAANNPRRAMKLTAEKVREIRKAHATGEISSVIAKRFGISPCTVRNLAFGRSWKALTS